MVRHDYSRLEILVQKIGASSAGSWFFARTLHYFDRLFINLTSGRATMTNVLAGLPVVDVTMTGAKSGLTRMLPLAYIRDEADSNTFAVVASNYGQRHNPAWYYNLKANPRVQCSIRGHSAEYIASEASDDEYEKFWRGAEDTYLGYKVYKQRAAHRHIPIMVLTPANE